MNTNLICLIANGSMALISEKSNIPARLYEQLCSLDLESIFEPKLDLSILNTGLYSIDCILDEDSGELTLVDLRLVLEEPKDEVMVAVTCYGYLLVSNEEDADLAYDEGAFSKLKAGLYYRPKVAYRRVF